MSPNEGSDEVPLMSSGGAASRRRRPPGADRTRRAFDAIPQSTMDSSDYNDLFTFRGKKYLGRTFSPDGLTSDDAVVFLLVVALVVCLSVGYACLFHFDTFHFHLSHAYARLGHVHAQNVVGERLLHGRGVDKDEEKAMEWFRLASDSGHPHASYNLAIGHLTGIKTDVRTGEVHQLIRHAHDNGVEEAADVMHNACGNGHCDE